MGVPDSGRPPSGTTFTAAPPAAGPPSRSQRRRIDVVSAVPHAGLDVPVQRSIARPLAASTTIFGRPASGRAGRACPQRRDVPWLMRITRVFTGDDGHSHFEDLEVPMEDRPYGLISDWLPATGVAFRVNHPDQNLDFHVAPRRQLVVNLYGAVEIETHAGDVRRLGAGDILLADDLSGTVTSPATSPDPAATSSSPCPRTSTCRPGGSRGRRRRRLSREVSRPHQVSMQGRFLPSRARRRPHEAEQARRSSARESAGSIDVVDLEARWRVERLAVLVHPRDHLARRRRVALVGIVDRGQLACGSRA